MENNKLLQADSVALQEIIAQLEKDLQMSGNEYHFSQTIAGKLIDELATLLEQIDLQNRLSGLIYRIDINMDKLETDNFYFDLSQTIWNRCFQKVWFRKNWGK